jgi:small-conductance mechanosensitive channel
MRQSRGARRSAHACATTRSKAQDPRLPSRMKLTCNIDARGKLVRLIYGVVFVVVGVVMLLTWARSSGSVLAWAVTIALVVGGAFAIFEARAGWCIVRAMGFKTPI